MCNNLPNISLINERTIIFDINFTFDILCIVFFLQKTTPNIFSRVTTLGDEPLTFSQEAKAYQHLKRCVIEHQRTLNTILLIEKTFSEPTFAQFSVSLVIICATAFQLVSVNTRFFLIF